MATSGHHNSSAVTPDSLITIKISVNDSLKKLKLPLEDLGANVLIDKLRHCLAIKPEQQATFERFSDSAGGYITLDATNPQVFKTLIRAAKAKLKLRLKATVTPDLTQEKAEEASVAEDTTVMSPPKAVEPVIARSPAHQVLQRDSKAFDRRSIGSGIFEFREARASEQTLNEDEAPVPKQSTADRSEFVDALGSAGETTAPRELTFRTREPTSSVTTILPQWSVYCNNCDVAMLDAHHHCSICDGGDYDLCESCIASGKLCPGKGHWLIKRFIKEGKVITSTTERVGRKILQETEQKVPGAFAEELKLSPKEPASPIRTCNNCVCMEAEDKFVTCQTCDDFDLCIACHLENRHGHHPAHGFQPATEKVVLAMASESLLAPGRNVRHNAICDGCDKNIYGIRHKCLNCPDWDYCNDCVQNACQSHPNHRFTPLYTPIADVSPSYIRHTGIYCDGPLCVNKSDQSFITGIRYKCAVCHDTDFCANCESSPTHNHNRTHPLIKFKTPVRNVSITTMNEDLRGNVRNMGDRRIEPVAAPTAEVQGQPMNFATPVTTVAETKPTEINQEKLQPLPAHKSEITPSIAIPGTMTSATLLHASFVHDSITDGMVVEPGARFTQIWTLKNDGAFPWPPGCSVRYVGGDNMLNVDNAHPASVSDIANATESNVVGRDVQIGEEIAFKINFKAPSREGKAISYWRLKTADGTPFGHRLWCDIEVRRADHSAPCAAPVELKAPYATPVEQPVVPLASHSNLMNQQHVILHAMQAQMAQRQEMLDQFPTPQSPESYPVSRKMASFRRSREQVPPFSFSSPVEGGAAGLSCNAADLEADKARKDAAKLRVEAIKAKILKARAEKHNRASFEAKQAMAAQLKAAAERKSAEETAKVQKIIEEAIKAPAEENEDLASSQMVFPKLEKESPSSSILQSSTSSNKGKAAYVENEEREVERSASPVVAATLKSVVETVPFTASPTEEGFDTLADDLEVLSADGLDSDDGFMTDEEYDILDASDSETIVSP